MTMMMSFVAFNSCFRRQVGAGARARRDWSLDALRRWWIIIGTTSRSAYPYQHWLIILIYKFKRLDRKNPKLRLSNMCNCCMYHFVKAWAMVSTFSAYNFELLRGITDDAHFGWFMALCTIGNLIENWLRVFRVRGNRTQICGFCIWPMVYIHLLYVEYRILYMNRTKTRITKNRRCIGVWLLRSQDLFA